jgi:PAS domain S-box-containing protein
MEPAPLDQAQLARVFAEAAAGMARTTFDGTVLDANDALCTMLGRPRDLIVGHNVSEFTHPDDRARDAREIAATASGEQPTLDRDKRYLRLDGTVVHGRVTATVFEDGPGRGCLLATVIDVSARIAAEEQVARERERFARVFSDTASGMALLSPDGRITDANGHLCEMLGRPADELVGTHFSAITHPDDRPGDAEATEALLSGALPTVSRRKRYLRADGAPVWARITVSLVRESDGRPAYFISQMADVTEIVEAEQQRELLLEQLPAAICRFDVASRVMLFTTPQIAELTGEPPEAWLGAEGYAGWVGAMVDPAEPDWEQLARRNEPWHNQYQWRRSDGSVRWFRSITRMVGDGVVQAMVFDATAEVEAGQALAGERARYQWLVEQIPGITILRNMDGALVYVSPQIDQVLGYRGRDWLNDPPYDLVHLVHPDDQPVLQDALDRLRARRTDRTEVELRIRAKDGAWRTLLARHALVDTPDGESVIQGIAIDTSALREAEQRSRDAIAALIDAAESERARIATELHDDTIQVLVATLFTIDRMTAALTRGDESVARTAAAAARDALAHAVERTRRLTFELRPQLLEASGIGAAVRELAATLARDVGWSVTVEADPRRYPPEIEALVYRTVREALTNVRKHAQAGAVAVELGVRAGYLHGAIRDDGRGFDPAAVRERSLLHFGIEMMRERLELAGGSLDVASEPGSGTTVSFALPVVPARAGHGGRRATDDATVLRMSLAVANAIADARMPDTAGIVRVACATLAGLLECAAVTGYVSLDDRVEQLCVFDNDALEENLEGMRRPIDRGTAGIVFSTAEPVLHSDLADGRELRAFSAPHANWVYQSVCAVPVMCDGAVAAVIATYALEVNSFDRSSLSVLGEVADQIGVAIGRAQRRTSDST